MALSLMLFFFESEEREDKKQNFFDLFLTFLFFQERFRSPSFLYSPFLLNTHARDVPE